MPKNGQTIQARDLCWAIGQWARTVTAIDVPENGLAYWYEFAIPIAEMALAGSLRQTPGFQATLPKFVALFRANEFFSSD